MNIKIGVVGLGYVGLPLALEFAKKLPTVGFDKSKKRISYLKRNIDLNNEISKKKLQSSKIKLTSDIKKLDNINFYVITVPTPISKNKKPDISSLKEATRSIALYLKKGDIVVYESTVYPGLTEDICIPLLEKFSNLKLNLDFFCGYSPERLNPGDRMRTVSKINKIVSASNAKSLKTIFNVYKKIIKAKIFKASSIKVAEAAKIIENTQRDLNIALVNELSQIFNLMNIDTNEVLQAAATKWNFHLYKPGLVGGHCIGVDPYYLTYKSLKIGYKPKIILAGRKINDGMSNYVAKLSINYLKKNFKSKNPKILILGCSFKEDCNDIRNSKVFDLYNNLKKKNFYVNIYDPIVNRQEVFKQYKINLSNFPKKKYYDLIILAVSHMEFRRAKFLDAKNIFGKKNAKLLDLKSHYKKRYSDFRL